MTSPTPVRRPAPTPPAPARSPLVLLTGVVLSILAGSCLAVQSRFNGTLGRTMGDPYLAALVSFGIGCAVLLVGSVLLPAGRRGAARLPGVLRTRRIRWWYFLAGVFGAYLVIAQTLTTALLGVSVFILGLVVGQSLGGMLVDRWGIGPGGMQPLSRYRVLGTVLILAAVAVAMVPRFSAGSLHMSTPALVGAVALPVLAGVLNTVQTAWNAHIAAATGTPITSTLTNFAAGTVALVIVAGVARWLTRPGPVQWPHDWWLYTGAILGIVFVAAGAVLARHVGVLQTSLGLVTGMLLGALVLDVAVPTAATVVTPVTVAGTLATLVGLVVVTLPWGSRRRS